MTNTPQKNNPLHGLTLEFILTELFNHYGWRGLFDKIAIDCFAHEQSIKSSLKFLRKTPWAREKVELLYGFMLREARRESQQVALREAAAQENNVNGGDNAESV